MALHWSMHNVKTCLPSELFERIDEANTNPHEQTPESAAGYLPMMNGKTGELFMKIPADDPRRVLRSRLRSLFQIGIDVQFNMELTDVKISETGVTATFNGTEKREGYALIGSDGGLSLPSMIDVCQCLTDSTANSLVRASLVKPEDNILQPASVWALVSISRNRNIDS